MGGLRQHHEVGDDVRHSYRALDEVAALLALRASEQELRVAAEAWLTLQRRARKTADLAFQWGTEDDLRAVDGLIEAHKRVPDWFDDAGRSFRVHALAAIRGYVERRRSDHA